LKASGTRFSPLHDLAVKTLPRSHDVDVHASDLVGIYGITGVLIVHIPQQDVCPRGHILPLWPPHGEHSFPIIYTNSPCFLRTAKVHCRVHKPYPNSDDISVQSILMLSYSLCLGISWDIPSVFPTNIMYTFFILHACYMPHLSHSPWFDDLHNICWRLQILIKLLVM
jgi:hypothetical protein